MNAKQAYEKMMAARASKLSSLMAPVMREIEEAVKKGEGHCYVEDLVDDVLDELRRRDFTVVVSSDSRNTTTWRVEWPKPK